MKNIAISAVVLILFGGGVHAESEGYLLKFANFMKDVRSLNCTADIYVNEETRVKSPSQKVGQPYLKVSAVWFSDGRYSYEITYPQTIPPSSFKCIFDGKEFFTIARQKKVLITSGPTDQKFHNGVMSGVNPFFEPLRFLFAPTLTGKKTLSEGDSEAVANPLQYLSKLAASGLASKNGSIDVKAEGSDGAGTYKVKFGNENAIPNEISLFNDSTGRLISECIVTDIESIPNDSIPLPYAKKLTTKAYTADGQLDQSLTVVVNNVSINEPNAVQALTVDFGMANYIGDGAANVIVPVGRSAKK